MSRETVQPRSADAAPPLESALRTPVVVALVAAWLACVGIYAVLFSLTGFPFALALRGALANGIPDGLLALVVLRAARGMDRVRDTPLGLLRTHAPRAALLVGLALAGKSFLLWIEFILVRGDTHYRIVAGIVGWHLFISVLVYIAAAAAAQAWMTARRLKEEEAHDARAEALRARAELSALRAQLNPHFLFNVLHSVLGMVRRDPAVAEAALENLGDLLHYAIRVHRDGVDWTALRHEWEFMETYLKLEALRLGDRLRIDCQVDEAALEQSVPTFSLQPLVENAVRHGIAPRAAGGRIAVASRLEGGTLRLEVSNDCDGRAGSGIHDGGTTADGDEGGLGLRVLRERLEALYRGRARMAAGPTAEGGYNVVLTLPLAAGGVEAGE
jgi:hypothetical protein